jgi:putative transposase
MSRPGTPQDNAKAESFMGTLKAEEVDGKAYRSREDAESKIGTFIDDVYNARRLHSSIGYKPPIEFEDEFRQARKREANQLMPIGVSQTKGAVHHAYVTVIPHGNYGDSAFY